MPESLLTRLASYSQNPNKRSIENFLTEVIAYLINTDRVFRRTFVTHVIPDSRMRKGFRFASALPQQTIGRGIVDVVLEGSTSRLLVELKVGARETETKVYGHGWVPQVQKYLSYRAGYVAYLTTRNAQTPTVNSKFFLGHFLLESLQGRLKRRRLSATGQLLLDFMEENDMKALTPFTTNDLRNAGQSFSFAKKCEAVLDEVVTAVEPEFRKIFHTRTGFTPGHFSPTYNSAYCYTRRFRYGVVTRLYLSLDPWENELGFGVSAVVPRRNMYAVNRVLNWEESRNELYLWHPLKSGITPTALIKKAIPAMHTLKKALDRAS